MSKKQSKKANNVSYQITWEDVYANQERIMTAGRKVGLNFSDREDLVEELVKKALNKDFSYDSTKGTVEGYLYRTAHNKAIDMLRKEARGPIYLDSDTLEWVSDEAGNWTKFDCSEKQERNELLQRGLAVLSKRYPSQRTVAFKMFSVEHKKGKEVASKLGVTEKYVNGSVIVGKGRLKEIIKELERKDSGFYRHAG